MSIAPPCGGLLLNHHWTQAWTLVPMTVAALGLLSAFIAARHGRLAAPPNGGAQVT
jgi:hypothetical protein